MFRTNRSVFGRNEYEFRGNIKIRVRRRNMSSVQKKLYPYSLQTDMGCVQKNINISVFCRNKYQFRTKNIYLCSVETDLCSVENLKACARSWPRKYWERVTRTINENGGTCKFSRQLWFMFKMFCSACGGYLNGSGANFCSKCGAGK